jgi:hypothetical protein
MSTTECMYCKGRKTYEQCGSSGGIGGLNLLGGTVIIRLFLFRVLGLGHLHGLVVGLCRALLEREAYSQTDNATCLLLLIGHMFPLLRDHAQEIRIGEVGMLLLELLTDLVLEEDVGRRGPLGSIGILGFGIAFSLLGTLAILEWVCGLALALGRLFGRDWSDA